MERARDGERERERVCVCVKTNPLHWANCPHSPGRSWISRTVWRWKCRLWLACCTCYLRFSFRAPTRFTSKTTWHWFTFVFQGYAYHITYTHTHIQCATLFLPVHTYTHTHTHTHTHIHTHTHTPTQVIHVSRSIAPKTTLLWFPVNIIGILRSSSSRVCLGTWCCWLLWSGWRCFRTRTVPLLSWQLSHPCSCSGGNQKSLVGTRNSQMNLKFLCAP